MASDPLHHSIDFANRYVRGLAQSSFNAATALFRLEVLANDIEKIQSALQIAQNFEDEREGNSYVYRNTEVFSLYAVGIVTCLEWHARSRLADLFAFMPSALAQDDLKPLANAKMMAQMVENDVSAAQLIAGMTNVATAEKYIQIVQRVFERLGIDESPYAVVEGQPGQMNLFDGSVISGIKRLKTIFEFRNAIVHEIGIEANASYVMRNRLSYDSVLEWCRFAISCVRDLEMRITQKAPRDFPNRLNERGNPEGNIEALDQILAQLEAEVSSLVALKTSQTDRWDTARSMARDAIAAEDVFSHQLYSRLVEIGGPVRTASRNARMSYLKVLKRSLELLPDLT